MKVPWPLSAREVVLHFFEFEYLKHGLVIVVLNSISDLDHIDKSTHGYTRDCIPNPDDVVRIDVVGGFALQKVSAGRSYFRTIANMDIKLDFMPPAFINFVSRQLIGSGFKLYKKEVASVAQGDDDFGNALEDPLYEEIREAFYSDNVSPKSFELEEIKHDGGIILLEPGEMNSEDIKVKEEIQSDAQITGVEITEVEEIPDKASGLVEEHQGKYDRNAEADKHVQIDGGISSHAENYIIGDEPTVCEIEEETGEADTKESKHLDKYWKTSSNPETNQTEEKSLTNDNKKVIIHPEVEKALGILEKAISFIREQRSDLENDSLPNKTVEKQTLGGASKKESTSSKSDQICQKTGMLTGLSEKDPTATTSREARISSGSHGSRHIASNSFARESSHSKVAPASPDDFVQDPGETNLKHTTVYSIDNRIASTDDKSMVGVETSSRNKKNKKWRYCCLHCIYGQQAARA